MKLNKFLRSASDIPQRMQPVIGNRFPIIALNLR